jgi:hypothetical protein
MPKKKKNRKNKAEKRLEKQRRGWNMPFSNDQFTEEAFKDKKTLWNTAKKKYGIKLSDALKVLCEPIADELTVNMTEEQELKARQEIYNFGMNAWNCCVIHQNKQDALSMGTLYVMVDKRKNKQGMPPLKKRKQIFDNLIKRKFELFSEIDAIIVRFELDYTADAETWNLRVYSHFQ